MFLRNHLESKGRLLAVCASGGVTRATGMAFEINTSVSHSRKVDGGAQSRRVGLRASLLSDLVDSEMKPNAQAGTGVPSDLTPPPAAQLSRAEPRTEHGPVSNVFLTPSKAPQKPPERHYCFPPLLCFRTYSFRNFGIINDGSPKKRQFSIISTFYSELIRARKIYISVRF